MLKFFNIVSALSDKVKEAAWCKLAGEEFYCTSSDMARAFGVSNEEMNKCIREYRIDCNLLLCSVLLFLWSLWCFSFIFISIKDLAVQMRSQD